MGSDLSLIVDALRPSLRDRQLPCWPLLARSTALALLPGRSFGPGLAVPARHAAFARLPGLALLTGRPAQKADLVNLDGISPAELQPQRLAVIGDFGPDVIESN